jgi:Fe-S-cluster containining protein
MVVETFCLHLEFKDKNGDWSINLPFLCIKCGKCCTMDDFLTSGKIHNLDEHPEVEAKMKTLSEEIGKIWEADEAKYDEYITRTQCPFLVDKYCSIYEIRPNGCRLFPNTLFGMETKDCEPLN